MANLTTVTDLIQDVLHRSGENPTDISGKYYNKVIQYINRARLDIVKGKSPIQPDKHVNFNFSKCYPPFTFTLQYKYSTGTVSLTNNSATATLSAIPTRYSANLNLLGWYLYVDNEKDTYRVNAHTSGTAALTLDSVFTGTTNTTATYKLVKLEYDIGANDVIRLLSPLRIYRYTLDNEPFITGLPERSFDRMFPLRELKSGMPEAFKVMRILDNNITIMLSRYRDDDIIKIEAPYVKLPTDLTSSSTTSEILVPREYRYVISDLATYFILLDKNDNRAASILNMAQSGFEEMAKDYEYSWEDVDNDFARVIAREDDPEYNTRILLTDSDVILG